MSVTAIGAIYLTRILQKENWKFVIFSSLNIILRFTIKPVNIAISRPPKGNITFEVKLSNRSKKLYPNNFKSAATLNDRIVPMPNNQVKNQA